MLLLGFIVLWKSSEMVVPVIRENGKNDDVYVT